MVSELVLQEEFDLKQNIQRRISWLNTLRAGFNKTVGLFRAAELRGLEARGEKQEETNN